MTEPILGQFDLAADIARLAPGEAKSKRRAEILIKNDRFRVLLMTMLAGAELQEHSAQGPVMIQGLQGELVVTLEGQERPLLPGTLIVLDNEVKHSVRAITDGALLLTIGWDPSWHGDRSGATELD